MGQRWKPGQQIVWIRVARGPGYVERVPGVVIRVTPRRVVIEVRERDGQLARHNVSPVHLQSKPRQSLGYKYGLLRWQNDAPSGL